MKVLVVSQDAGGAEIVSSWVQQNPLNEYQFILKEPAKNIFEKKMADVQNNSIIELKNLINKSDFVITGTSASSDFEKRTILISKKLNTRSVTFLDYWYGFRGRFLLDHRLILPDEIWVGDNYAFDIAKKELPEANIILKSNPYIDDILEEVEKEEQIVKRSGGTLKILYLCQPYNQIYRDKKGKKRRLTEKIALGYFFQAFTFKEKSNIEIIIRLHPLENLNKYKKIIDAHSAHLKITVSHEKKLVEDLLWANLAVGMHAQALAVAVAMDKKVFHSIPEGAQPCALPHNEIMPFRNHGLKLIAEHLS
jgi:hypothetical protein